MQRLVLPLLIFVISCSNYNKITKIEFENSINEIDSCVYIPDYVVMFAGMNKRFLQNESDESNQNSFLSLKEYMKIKNIKITKFEFPYYGGFLKEDIPILKDSNLTTIKTPIYKKNNYEIKNDKFIVLERMLFESVNKKGKIDTNKINTINKYLQENKIKEEFKSRFVIICIGHNGLLPKNSAVIQAAGSLLLSGGRMMSYNVPFYKNYNFLIDLEKNKVIWEKVKTGYYESYYDRRYFDLFWVEPTFKEIPKKKKSL